ncbi:MAG: hypothetical protein ACLQJR_18125 [Stellaceae bacterium]
MRRSLSLLLLLLLLALCAHPAAAKGGAPAAQGGTPGASFVHMQARLVPLIPLVPWGYRHSDQADRSRIPAAATVETTAQGVTVIRGPGSHHSRASGGIHPSMPPAAKSAG